MPTARPRPERGSPLMAVSSGRATPCLVERPVDAARFLAPGHRHLRRAASTPAEQGRDVLDQPPGIHRRARRQERPRRPGWPGCRPGCPRGRPPGDRRWCGRSGPGPGAGPASSPSRRATTTPPSAVAASRPASACSSRLVGLLEGLLGRPLAFEEPFDGLGRRARARCATGRPPRPAGPRGRRCGRRRWCRSPPRSAVCWTRWTVSDTTVMGPIMPRAPTWVPPHSSMECGPARTTRTRSPYLSPKKARAPMASAWALVVSTTVTSASDQHVGVGHGGHRRQLLGRPRRRGG